LDNDCAGNTHLMAAKFKEFLTNSTYKTTFMFSSCSIDEIKETISGGVDGWVQLLQIILCRNNLGKCTILLRISQSVAISRDVLEQK